MFDKQAIAEIKKSLTQHSDPSHPYIAFLKTDERKGVQKLLASWEKGLAKVADLREQAYQMQHYERQAIAKGFQLIAGIDEVGRGPLAGPVVAAAVILPINFDLLEVNDSKQLSIAKRDSLFDKIQDSAVAIGIGIIDEATIDQVNIYQATKLAMKQAVAKLSFTPDYLLIDAMVLDSLPMTQESIIKGDTKSVSIAAASIIAKVTRDRLMAQYDRQFPGYGFANNAGYGTKEHLNGLTALGPCSIHRKTFAPVKNYY